MGDPINLKSFESFRRVANQWWACTLMQTRISAPGEGDDTTDAVDMTAEDGTVVPIDLTRLEMFGDVIEPPADIFGIVLRKSDGGVVVPLAQAATRPTDGKRGDRGLYCSVGGTTLFLRGAEADNPGQVEIRQASGSSLILDPSGAVTIADGAGNTVAFSDDTLTVSDVVKAKHFSGDGDIPTASRGEAVGSSGDAVVFAGTDSAFTVLLSVVNGIPGKLATIQFAKPYAVSPRFVCPVPLSPELASPPLNGTIYPTAAADSVDLSVTTIIPDGFYLLSVGVIE